MKLAPRSIYGVFEYSKDQAEALVSIAKTVIFLMKNIESKVFGGGLQQGKA